jgi:hypothetical protein
MTRLHAIFMTALVASLGFAEAGRRGTDEQAPMTAAFRENA